MRWQWPGGQEVQVEQGWPQGHSSATLAIRADVTCGEHSGRRTTPGLASGVSRPADPTWVRAAGQQPRLFPGCAVGPRCPHASPEEPGASGPRVLEPRPGRGQLDAHRPVHSGSSAGDRRVLAGPRTSPRGTRGHLRSGSRRPRGSTRSGDRRRCDLTSRLNPKGASVGALASRTRVGQAEGLRYSVNARPIDKESGTAGKSPLAAAGRSPSATMTPTGSSEGAELPSDSSSPA